MHCSPGRRARDCREWNDQELRRRSILTGEPTKEAPPSMGPSTPGKRRFERLRRLNLPIAAFCAAVTGMVPLGLMAFLLFSDVAEGFAGAAQLAELRLSVETLRQEVRRQDPAVASRLLMLEEAIAGDTGAASSSVAAAAADAARKSSAEARAAAERAAALAAAVGERSGTSDPTSDAIAGLGVDWAAWSAGADIDRSQSSGGLGRSLLGRLGRVLATLVPVTRTFLGAASHSPEVVLTWETGLPSRCFELDLPRGSLAIRFSRDIRPSHVVLEQSPLWATTLPRAAPREFHVDVWPSEGDLEPYAITVGSYEYQLTGPRSQVFAVNGTAGSVLSHVRGLRIRVESNWGEDHTLLCRVRVFGAP